MNIYSQVIILYGMTFLISMFVALIIWVFAKIIDLNSSGGFNFFGKPKQ